MATEACRPILAFVLDWETGGLLCSECGVTQISVHAVRLDNFDCMGKFMRYILPYTRRTDKGKVKVKKALKNKYDDGTTDTLMTYTQAALDVQGITMDILKQKGIALDDMVEQLLEWIDEMMANADTTKGKLPILVGQNIAFDEGFLSQVMEYTGKTDEFKKRLRGMDDFWGNWHPTMLDTIVIGQLALSHNPEVPSYKLELLCEFLGIDLVDAHDADADVEATADVMRVLGNRMRAEDGNLSDSEQRKQDQKTRKHFKI